MKNALHFLLLFTTLSAYSQVPPYYNNVDLTLTGQELKTELAQKIITTHTTVLEYTPGVWEALQQTDLDPENPGNVLLIYGYDDTDNDHITDRSRDKDLNGGNAGTDWNREHTYPRSLGEPNLEFTGPGSDAHHLRASDVTMNSNRGNLPFEDSTTGGTARRINNSWYPGDEWKGDVARMMMYMYLHYDTRCDLNRVGVGENTFSAEIPDLFLQWNADDPVSQVEINRNNILETVQGNRNPFIDNPAFATTIWDGPQAEDLFENQNPAVLINEVDSDTEGTDALEFIELYDGGFGNTSLDGLVIVLYNGSNDQSYNAISLDGQSTDADGYFVIGSSLVANVDLEAFTTNGLQNGADAVALYTGSADDFQNGTAVTDANIVDAVVYDTNDADDSVLLDILTPNQTQINEDQNSDKDFHSIQRTPNGQGGLRNTSTYSAATPTPGASNDIQDSEAPTTPLNLQATNITANSLELSWDESTDNIGVNEYEVFQDGTSIGTTTTTSNSVTGLDPETTYSYTVLAVDASNNSSAQSESIEITTLEGDDNPPTSSALLISGVYDGPLTGGVPKGVELYVSEDISDLSSYGIGSANNGGGSDGEEFTFPAVPATAGEYIYISSESPGFSDFFGFAPDYTTGAMGINGDDAIELFQNGTVIDVFGDINVDGTGEVWEYLDGWAYRVDETGPDGTIFIPENWTYSGPNALDGENSNSTAATPFPIGTYLGLPSCGAASSSLILSVIYDGPLTGGIPKGVELFVTEDIADLSIYGIGSANNGGGTDGEEFTFPAVPATAGEYIYVSSESDGFTAFFGFAPDYINGAMSINGDDAIELFQNGTVIDVFGDINVDGNGEDWEYLDGWAARVTGTDSDGSTFALSNWTFSGPNALDGATTNANATSAIPISQYTFCETTTDSEAPSAPTNLETTDVRTTEIDLSWTASTDNVGVTAYQIFANGSLIGSTPNTTFTATGLTPNTLFEFFVVALDAAGNESEQSNLISETTEAVSEEIITIAEARDLPDGTTVTISGVITVSDQFAGPAFIQDETGGIAVFDDQIHGDMNYEIGDSITITAVRSSFNDQIQLGTVTNIIDHGPITPLEPVTITIDQLADFAGQLIRIVDVNFSDAGQLLCGNTNYDISDSSGMGELRIDGDVDGIIGMAQPEICSELVGVVGRFQTTFQVLPRGGDDLPCTEEFGGGDEAFVGAEDALTIATWNIEWFGAEDQFGTPSFNSSETIQKEAAKDVITQIDADIIAVQEIVDEALFETMVNELNGYDYILSPAFSLPNNTDGNSQKLGFIYKTSVISILATEALFTDDHPFYNGGDESTISDFPNEDKTRFFASGRLPFLLTAEVTNQGATEGINFIALHARANGSTESQDRYDMRKYDVEFLKDYLDNSLAEESVVILGDFNDDVDETVADGVSSTVTTYDAYIQDPEQYFVTSSVLSNRGLRSFAFRDNMIDHIMITNELYDNYLANSVNVWDNFFTCDYADTTSDHFPVSAQLYLNVEVAEEETPGTAICKVAETLTITMENDGWLNLIDESQNLIASIRPNENDLGNITGSLYIEDTDVRFIEDDTTQPYLRRSISIIPENQPTSQVDLRLYFTEDEFNDFVAASSVTGIDELVVYKQDDTNCDAPINIIEATPLLSANSVFDATQESTTIDFYAEVGVDSFSTFFFGDASLILPIKLVFFKATKNQDVVDLNWQTASEQNNDFFEIQRSIDGVTWEIIGIVTGQGNSSQPTDYQFTDSSPINGINYYRFRQVDFDGTSSYSDIEEISFNDQISFVSAMDNQIQVAFPQSGDATISIYDMNGKVVWQNERQVLSGINTFDVNNLSSSVYILMVIQNGEWSTTKFFIN